MKIALALGLVLIACALSSCTLSQLVSEVENNSPVHLENEATNSVNLSR